MEKKFFWRICIPVYLVTYLCATQYIVFCFVELKTIMHV